MSGRETPKWPRKNHANLLRSVKFPNFRSLRVVEGKGERWWKERAIPESKGQVSVWLKTPGSSSVLSTFILRISPCRVSLLEYLPRSLPFILHHSPYSSVRSVLFSHPVAILCIVSLRFLRLPPFSPLALTFPRLTFVFYTSTGVLTVYFDLDLREISRNSLGADGSLGKIPFCTQWLLSRWSRPGRSAAGMEIRLRVYNRRDFTTINKIQIASAIWTINCVYL